MPLSVALEYAEDSRPEILCLHRSVAGRVDLRAELRGDSDTILPLMRYSARYGALVVAAVRAAVGGGEFNSAIVIGKGKVLGVSDQMFPQKGLQNGACMRCYRTSAGLMGLIVSDDIRRPQLWHALSKAKSDFVFAFDEKVFDETRDNAFLQSMSYCCGLTVYAHFCDLSHRYNCFGKCDDTEYGLSRRMTFVTHKKTSCFFSDTIKVYVEKP